MRVLFLGLCFLLLSVGLPDAKAVETELQTQAEALENVAVNVEQQQTIDASVSTTSTDTLLTDDQRKGHLDSDVSAATSAVAAPTPASGPAGSTPVAQAKKKKGAKKKKSSKKLKAKKTKGKKSKKNKVKKSKTKRKGGKHFKRTKKMKALKQARKKRRSGALKKAKAKKGKKSKKRGSKKKQASKKKKKRGSKKKKQGSKKAKKKRGSKKAKKMTKKKKTKKTKKQVRKPRWHYTEVRASDRHLIGVVRFVGHLLHHFSPDVLRGVDPKSPFGHAHKDIEFDTGHLPQSPLEVDPGSPIEARAAKLRRKVDASDHDHVRTFALGKFLRVARKKVKRGIKFDVAVEVRERVNNVNHEWAQDAAIAMPHLKKDLHTHVHHHVHRFVVLQAKVKGQPRRRKHILLWTDTPLPTLNVPFAFPKPHFLLPDAPAKTKKKHLKKSKKGKKKGKKKAKNRKALKKKKALKAKKAKAKKSKALKAKKAKAKAKAKARAKKLKALKKKAKKGKKSKKSKKAKKAKKAKAKKGKKATKAKAKKAKKAKKGKKGKKSKKGKKKSKAAAPK